LGNANLKFNVKLRMTTAQRKQIEEEEGFSMDHMIGAKDIQELLNKNQSQVIGMKLVVVATIYLLNPSNLWNAIHVEPSGSNFIVYVDRRVFESSKLKGKIAKNKGTGRYDGGTTSSF
jgi:hypothetical protein